MLAINRKGKIPSYRKAKSMAQAKKYGPGQKYIGKRELGKGSWRV